MTIDLKLVKAGRIEPHPQGGWMVVVHDPDSDVRFVGNDGRGLSREMAELALKKLNDFIASRN